MPKEKGGRTPAFPRSPLSIPRPGKEQALSRAARRGCRPGGHCLSARDRPRGERTAMTTFNDREKGFENKFAHDAEMQFKAQARAQQAPRALGGQHARQDRRRGRRLRDGGGEADFAEAGHEDVYRKLAADLDYRADEATIRAKMAEFLGTAKSQIMDELPGR